MLQYDDVTIDSYSTVSDSNIISTENKFGALHYKRTELVIRQAKGCWLKDINGNEFLDCLAAYSAANHGHHHPKIVESIISALTGKYGSVLSNVAYSDSLGIFLSKVANFVPKLAPRFGSTNNKVLPKNGGVESVETAIKMARYFGFKEKGIPDGKQEIIVFNNNFHGRMITVISFSSDIKSKRGFGPLTPGFISVPYSDIYAVESAINDNTCGILVEPMQGEGGMIPPQNGFLKELRNICDDRNILLLFDEIQVGLGRTGKNFCFEHDDVIPDGLILGKALSGGIIPLSVFVTNSNLMDLAFGVGSDGSTFGGYPLACIAGVAAIDVLETEKLAQKANIQGNKLISKIMEIAKKSPYVSDVRGKGLFIGIEIENGNAGKYCRDLLKHGIFVNDSHGHTIRISPPLVINDYEIAFLCDALSDVLLS